jgi:glycine cleavage system H protein
VTARGGWLVVTLVFVAVLLAAFGLDLWVVRRLETKSPEHTASQRHACVELTVPRTLFFHPSHTWVRLDADGRVTVGIDDLVRTMVGDLGSIDLPTVGDHLKAGETAFTIHQRSQSLRLASPISGTVSDVNADLGSDPARLRWQPYKEGWALRLAPDDRLATELASMVVGRDAERWMADETRRVDRLFERGLLDAPAAGALERAGSEGWSAFASEVLGTTGDHAGAGA